MVTESMGRDPFLAVCVPVPGVTQRCLYIVPHSEPPGLGNSDIKGHLRREVLGGGDRAWVSL